VADARVGALDLAGAVLAWSTDAGAGQQIFQADVTLGTQRVLTSHFSQKPSVVADPTGRISWLDQVFSTSGIFVSAP
jgi:hypothetical protein